MQVKAKKHLGQHFLTDKNIAKKIVDSHHELQSPNMLLEIGPGMGVLTHFIIQNQPDNFFALDIDEESVDYLKKNYPKVESRFLFTDFLEKNIDDITSEKFDIIGNFPYNISTQIMFRVLEYRNRIDYVVGMFQKEVAQRIAEKPGTKTYGILSVLLQTFYDIEYLFTVNENVFNPPPKVKSAVIRLKRNERKELGCDEKLFFTIVKTAFNQRRKTLRNSLRSMIKNEEFLQNKMLDLRAERLSVEDFIFLTKEIQKG